MYGIAGILERDAAHLLGQRGDMVARRNVDVGSRWARRLCRTGQSVSCQLILVPDGQRNESRNSKSYSFDTLPALYCSQSTFPAPAFQSSPRAVSSSVCVRPGGRRRIRSFRRGAGGLCAFFAGVDEADF